MWDETDRANLASAFHKQLLAHYDIVIFTDVDEFIVIDPLERMSLRDYLAASDFTYKTVIGLNVLQDMGTESAITLDQPLLEQRKYAQLEFGYCKPLISKVPMSWGPGFHFTTTDPQFQHIDHNIFLFHLRAIDSGIAKERLWTLNSIRFSANSLSRQQGSHVRMSENDYLQRFFGTSAHDFAHAHQDLEFINSIFVDKVFDHHPIVRTPERFAKSIVPSSCDRAGANSAYRRTPNQRGCDTVSKLFSDSLKEMIEKTVRARNELCPCGSDKKYKHCHGAFL